MTYRPPSWTPKTRWARRLDEVMRERGWSKVKLFEEIGPDLGYSPKSRTALRPMLNDTDPTADQEQVLVRHFGELPPEPDPEPEPPASDTVRLVEAMTGALLAQTQALADLRRDLLEAKADAKRERAAMTKILARLEVQLAEVRAPAGRATGAAGQSPALT